MAKRTNDPITLGSGTFYMLAFSDAMPTKEDLFKAENRVGRTKGGAALEYTEETYEEKDDLGYVSKVITTSEEVILKGGLLAWTGKDLPKLVDRCKFTEENGVRTTKIGGAGNAQDGYFAIGFHHTDKKDGDIWIMIKGRNTAGLTMNFAVDEGTLLEPEFKALPHDEAGTLVEFIEETGATA